MTYFIEIVGILILLTGFWILTGNLSLPLIVFGACLTFVTYHLSKEIQK